MITKRLFSKAISLSSAEAHRDSLHFITESNRWSFKEVSRFTNAYAVGLLEMGLKPGDSISSWINCKQASENSILHLACYKAGLKVYTLDSGEDLEKALKSTSALVFSPWTDYNGAPRIDHVLSKVPALLQTPAGSAVKSSYATKYFVQTGFKTIRGTYKLKAVPVYQTLKNPSDSFDFSFKGFSVGNESFQGFSKEIGEKVLKVGDVVVNTVPCKNVFSVASLIASYQAGATVATEIYEDPGEVSKNLKASVLVTVEEKIKNFRTPASFDKVLVGVEKKDEIKKIGKLLEEKGVKTKSILGFSISDLKPIS